LYTRLAPLLYMPDVAVCLKGFAIVALNNLSMIFLADGILC
jgi:hypothetical protein